MVTKLKEVDAVMVGMGMTGAMLAKEFTMAGLTVVGLERGADRRPSEEVVLPRIRDELRYRPAHGADAGQLDRHHHLPQHLRSRPRCRSAAGGRSFPAKAWAAPLNRWAECIGAIADGFQAAYRPDRALWRKCHPCRHDHSGMAGSPMTNSSRITTIRQVCGVSGKAGNLKGQKIEGGNHLRRPAQQRISDPAPDLGQAR